MKLQCRSIECLKMNEKIKKKYLVLLVFNFSGIFHIVVINKADIWYALMMILSNMLSDTK